MSKIQELIDHGLQSRRGGNREEALRFFLSALGDDPENAWAAIEYAAELLHRGESDRAIEFLTQKSNEIKSKIDRQAVLIHLAQFYISLTLLDNAWAIYKEAIALIPSSSRPYKHFAASLRDAKKLSESTAVLRTGLTAVLTSTDRDDLLEELAIAIGCEYAPSFRPLLPKAVQAPAANDVVVLMMVKDEDDIIYENLVHHYVMGVRKFVISENASTDLTASEIKRMAANFPDATVVVISDPIREYIQDDKTNAMAFLASKYFAASSEAPRWFIPLDADEFICIPEPLASQGIAGLVAAARAENCKALSLFLCNSAADPILVKPDPFKRLTDQFNKIAHYNYINKPVQKVSCEWNEKAIFTMGNHFVRDLLESDSELFLACKIGVHIAHYPYRTLEHVRRKIINGGRAFDGVSNLKGGGHWRQYYAQYQQKGEAYLHEILVGYTQSVVRAAK